MNSRSLSLRDKIALMYTSAGSMRNIAQWVGVSHQKIGRALHHPEFGGYAETSRVWSDPGFIAAVDAAFDIHRDLVAQQARDDGIPTDPRFPVFTRRLPMHRTIRRVDKSTGEIWLEKQYNADGTPMMVPGMRVVVEHAHWLSDEMRQRVIGAANKSGFYHNLSVGSWVDLKSYFKQGESYWRAQNAKGKFRSDAQRAHRENLRRKIKRGQSYGFVYTPMTPLNFPNEVVFYDVNRKLNAKHAPAASDPRAMVASQILMQTDIAKDKRGAANLPKSPTNDNRKPPRKRGAAKPAPRASRDNRRR